MGQRDPNNVSGLLKLHLREHPLLSQETFDALKDILESGNSVSEGVSHDMALVHFKAPHPPTY